jgi:hypothetical protein
MMNRYGDHLKLIGGSSIIFQLAQKYGNTIEYRPTQDLDFDLYLADIKTKEQAISEIVESLKGIEGFDVQLVDKGGASIKIYFTNQLTKEKVHVDIEVVSGYKFNGEDIASLEESLRKKIILNLEIVDRRFKDIVDVMSTLEYDYPSGITKRKILDLLEEHIDKLESYLTNETLEKQIELARKFKPKMLNAVRAEDYATAFYELIAGLNSDDVRDYDVFIRGKWQEGEGNPDY